MVTRRQNLVLAMLVVAASAFFAYQSIAVENKPVPKLAYASYVIKDLAIYRLSPQGKYVSDASAIVKICRMAIGNTEGFSVKDDEADGTTVLVVKATQEAHETFAETLMELRRAVPVDDASKFTRDYETLPVTPKLQR